MKHQTSELDGALLDRAVAKAAGYPLDSDGDRLDERASGGAPTPFHPSTDWRDGGPIIERERIDIAATDRDQVYGPTTWDAWADGAGGFMATGPTPLIAAMRAFVASKFGAEVELP